MLKTTTFHTDIFFIINFNMKSQQQLCIIYQNWIYFDKLWQLLVQRSTEVTYSGHTQLHICMYVCVYMCTEAHKFTTVIIVKCSQGEHANLHILQIYTYIHIHTYIYVYMYTNASISTHDSQSVCTVLIVCNLLSLQLMRLNALLLANFGCTPASLQLLRLLC